MSRLNKYFFVAKTSMQNTLSYRMSLFTSIFFYVFIVFIFLMLWQTIYSGQKLASGYTLNQIIWYCVITEMIWTARGSIFEEMNQDVKDGNIAYIINKPYSYILYQFSNGMGQIAVRLTLNIIVGIIMGLVFIGPLQTFRVGNLFYIAISIIFAIIINFFILFSIGLVSFWSEDSVPLRWIYSKIALIFGVFIPIEFFPSWAQKIIEYLPFSYITYGPAKLVTDFSMGRFTHIASVQFVYLVVTFCFASLLYSKGVKKLNVNGG